MKTIRTIIFSLAALLTGVCGYSQQYPAGILMNTFAFTPADMQFYSQSDYSFGTARSSAMGGAFTSLGGDLASIGINPAGIGMYRSSVWGFSPSLTVSSSRAEHSKGHDRNRTRFAFNNIGTVLAMSGDSRGLVGFNVGFSYNKVADFNYRTGVTLPAGDKSLLHIFQLQLNGLGVIDDQGWNGISKGDLDGNPFYANNIYLEEWGAVLSYLTGALTPVKNSPDNLLYDVSSIGPNAVVVPSLALDSRGSTGEYNISTGFNINNTVYLGLGMAIQDIYQHQEIMYSESYDYEGISGPPRSSLESMSYTQTSIMNGTGVNFKIGLIVRPVAGLRIGLAVHTPQTVEMTHEYVAEMGAHFWGLNNYRNEVSNLNIFDYNYTGPTRLMAGISYTLGNVAAISADYERVFYNGMRLDSGDRQARLDYRDHIRDIYRPADNFRAGVEVKPMPSLALRAGYAFYGTPFRHPETITTRYTPIRTHGISAGVGFWLGTYTTLDLAYMYSNTKFADMPLYSYQGEGFLPDPVSGTGYYEDNLDIAPSDLMRNATRNRHTMTVSFNFMF